MSIGLDTLIELAEDTTAAFTTSNNSTYDNTLTLSRGTSSRNQNISSAGGDSRVTTTAESNASSRSMSSSLVDCRDEDATITTTIATTPVEMKHIQSFGKKSNAALAIDLLHIIGPYNYILCTNCGSREAGGER